MADFQKKHDDGCGFASESVSYLYGELTAADRDRFETHLHQCASCRAEIASFATLRESFGEWKSEFDAMPTPAIDLPLPARQFEIASERVPFFEALRAWFAGIPALAAGSVALILVAGGLIIYLASRDGGEMIAGGNTTPMKINATPTAQPTPPVSESAAKTPATPDKTSPAGQEPQVVKIADKRTAPRTEPKRPPANVKRNEKKQSPALLDESEDEDTTLRLADLFDEIGTE